MILNTEKLNDIILKKNDILKSKPYPHLNPQGLINDEFFTLLRDNDPAIEKSIPGVLDSPPGGMKIHIKYDQRDGLNLPEIWKEFLDELENGKEYKDFVSEFIKRDDWHLEYEWSYLWKHSLHVHPDSEKKLFTHLFYLLDETNWNEEYGGQTTVFYKHKFGKKNSKEFEDYKKTWTPRIMGNYSFFFVRSKKSMHGVFPYDTEAFGKKPRKVFFPITTKNEK